MNYSLLRSKTFWTIIAMFVVGGGNAILQIIPPAYQLLIEAALTAVASAFHLNTAQKFGAVN